MSSASPQPSLQSSSLGASPAPPAAASAAAEAPLPPVVVLRMFRLLPASAAPARRDLPSSWFCRCSVCLTRVSAAASPTDDSDVVRTLGGHTSSSSSTAVGSSGGDERLRLDTRTWELHWDPAVTAVVAAAGGVDDAGEDHSLEAAWNAGASYGARRNELLSRQLEALHTHCFPVSYERAFFDELQLADVDTGITIVVLRCAPLPPASSSFASAAVPSVAGGPDQPSSLLEDGDALPPLSPPHRTWAAPLHPYLPPMEQGEMTARVRGLDSAGRVGYGPAPPAGNSRNGGAGGAAALMDASAWYDPTPSMCAPDAYTQMVAVLTIRLRNMPKRTRRAVTAEQSKAGVSSSSAVSSSLVWRREAYIPTLGVRKEMRRYGLAEALLDKGLAMVFDERSSGSGVARAWLHCLAGNHPATLMYLKRGFDVADFFPSFYVIRGRRYDSNLLAMVNPAAPLAVQRAAFAAYGFPEDVDLSEDDEEERHRLAVSSGDGGGGNGLAAPDAIRLILLTALSVFTLMAAVSLLGRGIGSAGAAQQRQLRRQ